MELLTCCVKHISDNSVMEAKMLQTVGLLLLTTEGHVYFRYTIRAL